VSRDIRGYWREVRTIEAGLPEFVWLMSGGAAPVQVSAAIAAKLLHAKSHRLASEEEVERHRAEELATEKAYRLDQKHKKGVAVIPVPPEVTPESTPEVTR
jgi:hypothetical protein